MTTTDGVNVTIHVCDEAKKVNQDFACNRDLLIAEMKYFKDYLHGDSKKWEDVDIAVHCDVDIFTWLMAYVHRNTNDAKGKECKLEPGNAISIMISSNFLKMPSLVDDCIHFCHDNLGEILSVPCNMNCIDDKLVARIATLFDPEELERVKDKKDKFKSKLFAHKLQELFRPGYESRTSPSNASQLFRCSFCSKYLVPGIQSLVKCARSRTSVDRHGSLTCSHVRDPTWNATTFLVNLKNELKTWRNVFWRVWGHVNHLRCSLCDEVFPCVNLRQCRFHPKPASFSSHDADIGTAVLGTGVHLCCQQPVLRFQSLTQAEGCCLKDHSLEEVATPLSSTVQGVHDAFLTSHVVYDCLVRMQDAVVVPFDLSDNDRQPDSLLLPDAMFTAEEAHQHAAPRDQDAASGSMPALGPIAGAPLPDGKLVSSRRVPPRQPVIRKPGRYRSRLGNMGDDEDSTDTDEYSVVRVVINPSANRRSLKVECKSSWDSSLSARLNQDIQREEDLKRINELNRRLLSRSERDWPRDDAQSVPQGSEQCLGGIYHRLECQLKASIDTAARSAAATTTSTATARR